MTPIPALRRQRSVTLAEWMESKAAEYQSRGPDVLVELTPYEFSLFALCVLAAGRVHLLPRLTMDASAQAKLAAQAKEQELVDSLAHATKFDYDRRRNGAARQLGIRNRTLDDAVNSRRAEIAADHGAAPLVSHWRVEPWADKVDGDDLIRRLVKRIRRLVVIGDDEAIAVAFWIVLAWCHEDAATFSPILIITSAEANSGKTTLGNVIKYLVPREISGVELTRAFVYRVVAREKPTIVMDESDSRFANNQPLTAVFNSGWTRGSGVWLMDLREFRHFPTFAPKCIVLKGLKLPDTTLSRGIIINMRRKLRTEQTEARFRHVDDAEARELRSKCLRWASEKADALAAALLREPQMPPEFDNRLAMNWELQFAIADLVGGEWPKTVRAAAVRLSNLELGSKSEGIQLLECVRKTFDATERKNLWSWEITAEINKRFEQRWQGPGPITARMMAAILQQFGIRPKDIRIGQKVNKGYAKADFIDSWNRYL